MTTRVGDAYARTVKARKPHYCEAHHYDGSCWIKAGDTYVREVLFPGDVNSSEWPWVMNVCVPHWREYDAERPLP